MPIHKLDRGQGARVPDNVLDDEIAAYLAHAGASALSPEDRQMIAFEDLLNNSALPEAE